MPINRWMDKEDVVILWNEMEYYSVIKMHEIPTPFAVTWMSLEIIILSEVSQRQISYDTTFIWNPENGTMNLFTKQKLTDRHRK